MGTWNSRGLRGSFLEEVINSVNQIYLDEKLGVIQKVPTPITPIEYDKSTNTIRVAYFEKKSTVDYIGNIQGVPVCFDAKETSTTNLPLYNIHEHQVNFMRAFDEQDGLAFLIVMFRQDERAYLLPFEVLEQYWVASRNGGRKSIPRKAFEDKYEIFPSGNIQLHYLEAVARYLKEKNASACEKAQ